MTKIYQAWRDESSITFGELKFLEFEKSLGAISEDAELLHTVEANNWEEAMTAHYLKMNWGEYKPEGEAEECPNRCGAMFYPEGSGECPNCGRIC